MKNFFTLTLCFLTLSFSAQEPLTYPYNPDVDSDTYVGIIDLIELLALYGTTFETGEIMVNDMTFEAYLNELYMLIEAAALPDGTSDGQFLKWNGSEWVLVIPSVGCIDSAACNYDSTATTNDALRCQYLDTCGVCDGPGDIYECGCADIPEGACDCDGNQLDALNVCGGECSEDLDGDGICDDGDSCIGEADECGVCNGPGAIYDCGCSGIAEGECDCEGTADIDFDGICDPEDDCVGTPDAAGVCNGDCATDADGDGICDDNGNDTCDGNVDACGVCNGPGPIYACGCTEIPEGDCDCSGNQFDLEGNCADYLADVDGDGIYDVVLDPCLGLTSLHYQGRDYGLLVIDGKCWFKENLAAIAYHDDSMLQEVADETAWNALNEEGAYCIFGADSIYGFLYNGYAAARDICPQYWDVPTVAEWDALVNVLGGSEVAGGAMKVSGTGYWDDPNTNATNASGFSALPAGERALGPDDFNGLTTKAVFWSHPTYTEVIDETENLASVLQLTNTSGYAVSQTHSVSRGHSIRCLRSDAVLGCTDINFMEYDPEANVNDGSCVEAAILGCTDVNFIEFDINANVDDGTCVQLLGCEDETTLTYGGYDYALKTIGNQCWFAENLRITTYLNNDAIPNLQNGSEWGSANYGAWVDYVNSSDFGNDYGKLYNWYAVDDARGLCPSGWHVPSDDEFKILEMELGMSESEANSTGYRGGLEGIGHQIKSSSFDSPSWNGSNSSGFSGLKGNCRMGDSNFTNVSNPGGFFWTSTASGENTAWFREVDDGYPFYRGVVGPSGAVYLYGSPLRAGFSVRCVRD